jgi:hypothetical protein
VVFWFNSDGFGEFCASKNISQGFWNIHVVAGNTSLAQCLRGGVMENVTYTASSKFFSAIALLPSAFSASAMMFGELMKRYIKSLKI